MYSKMLSSTNPEQHLVLNESNICINELLCMLAHRVENDLLSENSGDHDFLLMHGKVLPDTVPGSGGERYECKRIHLLNVLL